MSSLLGDLDGYCLFQNMQRIHDHFSACIIISGNVFSLAVFGGYDEMEGTTDLDSVELYNSQTGKWETTNLKLKEANSDFGFLSVKLANVISHL